MMSNFLILDSTHMYSHASSFLSLPLSVLQLFLWAVALVGVAMMTLWGRGKVTPLMLALYNGGMSDKGQPGHLIVLYKLML